MTDWWLNISNRRVYIARLTTSHYAPSRWWLITYIKRHVHHLISTYTKLHCAPPKCTSRKIACSLWPIKKNEMTGATPHFWWTWVPLIRKRKKNLSALKWALIGQNWSGRSQDILKMAPLHCLTALVEYSCAWNVRKFHTFHTCEHFMFYSIQYLPAMQLLIRESLIFKYSGCYIYF